MILSGQAEALIVLQTAFVTACVAYLLIWAYGIMEAHLLL